MKAGETVALVNRRDEVVGSLDVSDVFPWDKVRYIQEVYAPARGSTRGSCGPRPPAF